MPTQYDVFAKVIERAPVKPRDLGFSTPVNSHLSYLLDKKFIRKTSEGYYVPIKNDKTLSAFNIIKLCIRTGVNYNVFFSSESAEILEEISLSLPNLRNDKLSDNRNVLRIIDFLEKNQFILVRKLRPAIGTLLESDLLNFLIEFSEKKFKIRENFEKNYVMQDRVLGLRKFVFNPFDESYFAFITGSAQLEGSTLTVGETVEMLRNDIYPDKEHEEIQMVKNLDVAMRFVLDRIDEDLTISMIKRINKMVLFSLHKGAGDFKKTQNKIAGNPSFKTTPPHLVKSELERFCDVFNGISSREECLEKIGFIHNEIQRIHPFPDGNSRTTRMIVNFLLLKFEFSYLILRSGSFDRYMSLTKLSKKRDDEKLREFILHVLLHEGLLN